MASEGVATAKSSPEVLLAYVLVFFAVVAWGGSFVAARMVLYNEAAPAQTLSPTLLATVRFALAGAAFLPVLVHHLWLRRLSMVDVLALALLGQIAISVYFWLQYTGVKYTAAGVASILVVGLIPVSTAVVSRFLAGEPFGRSKLLGLLLGFGGLVLIVVEKDIRVAAETGYLLGVICLIANAFCFALYSALSKRFMRRHSSLVTTAGITCWGALGLLVISAVTDDWSSLWGLSSLQWWAILYLAAVCSVLAYFFYNYALTKVEAGRAASWVFLEPVVAVVLGVLLLHEIVSLQVLLGSLAILGGVVVITRG